MSRNSAKTNRIMRHLGFADDECGRYVAELRRVVAESTAKGRVPQIVVPWAINASNEERARLALVRKWEWDRGHRAEIKGTWADRWRVLAMNFRIWRDRMFRIRNPYEVTR